MRVIADGEVRYEGQGDYSGIESTPPVGPCFGQRDLDARILDYTIA